MKRHITLFSGALLASAALIQPIAASAQIGVLSTASAAHQSGSIKGLLGDASDGALNRLSKPGAFFADKAVRVLLPRPLRRASRVLRFTGKAGLTKDLTKSINDAAGLAALEAKPVFRAAIDDLTLSDGVGIVTGGKTGGTDYLRRTSGKELAYKVRPLVADALKEVGAYDQLESLKSVNSIAKLAGVDLSPEGLTDSVTKQAMDGIFTYIGQEEANFRKNPLGKGKGLLGNILGN